MAAGRRTRYAPDPWAHAPVEELQDQVLPRWFVLLAVALVPVAVGVLMWALLATSLDEVPLAARRPPPADTGLTHDVGALEVGASDPVPYTGSCPLLEGVQVAGTDADQANLRRSLAGACTAVGGTGAGGAAVGDAAARALEAFAEAGGVVRYAVFEQTGVDSTATTGTEPPTIYLNARFSATGALLGAPLILHDVVARTDPGDAATELAARRVEAAACASLFDELPRSCGTAVELVAAPDALAQLVDVGYAAPG